MAPRTYKHQLRDRAFILFVLLCLASCSSAPYFKERALHASYKTAPASILNRVWISHPSKLALRGMEQRGSQTPTHINERVAVAELAIAQTKKRSNQEPEKATSHYLEATEVLWPIINNTTPAVITGNSRNQQNQEKRLILAKKLYQHAVGQIARLSLQGLPITSSQKSIKLHNSVIRINSDSLYSIHPSLFDSLRPVNTSSYGNIGKPHHKTKGLGAALIGHQSRSSERLKSNRFIPLNGINMPINAIIDYPQPHQARLTLTNLLKTTTTQITGERRILAADYSAAIAASASMRPNRLGLSIALHPNQHVDRIGLFSLEPYNTNKIPIILTHGLASEPSHGQARSTI
jgi:hypothetical protein